MADIRWVYAPIGGGKSAYAVREVYRELSRSDRFVVTSLPLLLCNPPKGYETVQEYVTRAVSRPIDISRRLFILTFEQQREFWRYLPCDGLSPEDAASLGVELVRNELEGLGVCYGIKLPNVPHPLFKECLDGRFRLNPPGEGGHVNYYRRGCYYVLDEVHETFPARSWQSLGPQVEHYVSHLRKFNDDLDLLTQHPEKVDKNMRRNATEWAQVVNLGRTRLPMGVSLPKRFRVFTFQQNEMPTRSDKPTLRAGFQMGVKGDGFEFTYLTMHGASVRGAAAVEESRRKGFHWSVYLLVLAAVFAAAKYGPPLIENTVAAAIKGSVGGFQRGVGKGLGGSMPGSPAPAPAPAPAPPVAPVAAPPPANHFHPSTGSIAPRQAGPLFAPGSDGLFCTGVVRDGADVIVTLSDGRVAYASNGEVQDVGKRYVRVFGLPPIPWRDSLAAPPARPVPSLAHGWP